VIKEISRRCDDLRRKKSGFYCKFCCLALDDIDKCVFLSMVLFLMPENGRTTNEKQPVRDIQIMTNVCIFFVNREHSVLCVG